MESPIFRRRAVYNILVFCAWTVTSFLCHYTAKKFLTLLTHASTVGLSVTADDLDIETILRRLLSAVVLTSVQLALCVSFLNLNKGRASDVNELTAKLCHALATFATNVSMAFTFASSTFAIKMMEPITSALVQYFLLGTPLSPLALFSLPLIVGGAIAFADTPTNLLSNATLGVVAAVVSNILLALRNTAFKQLTHSQAPEDLLSLRMRASPTAIITLLIAFVYCCLPTNAMPLFSSSSLLLQTSVILSGIFHVIYSYISTGLVLTQISVVSHAVVNIMKRLTVVILLHAVGQRMAVFHNFLGLTVCTLGLMVYTWDKLRAVGAKSLEGTHTLSKTLSSTKLFKMSWIFTLFGTIGVITVYGPYSVDITNPIYLNQTNSRSFISTLNSFDSRGLEKPDETILAPNLHWESNYQSVLKNAANFLQLPLSDHPAISNMLSRELTTSDEIIRESQRLHFNIIGKELKKFKYAILFDIAAFENKGDPCITVGEIYFLARIHVDVIYYCNFWSCNAKNMIKAKVLSAKYSPDDLVILVHGGGNIIGYKENDKIRFKILRFFSKFKVLVFPQSIWMRGSNPKSAHVNNTIRHYCCNPNLTLVLRDSLSYSTAKKIYNGGTRLIMAPDMAFQIGRMPRFMSPVYDILWLKRSDNESPGYDIPKSVPPHLRVHISDWWEWLTPQAGNNVERAFYIATNGFFYLQRGRVIITDRLHGHILATLMDIPHVMIDNKARKLSSYHNTWTKSLSNVLIANNSSEALDMAIQLLDKYKESLPPLVPFLNIREDFSLPKIGVPYKKFP